MDLDEFSKLVEDVRLSGLFGGAHGEQVETAGLEVMAEQELCAAFAHLDLAHRCVEKAKIHHARGLASSPYRQ